MNLSIKVLKRRRTYNAFVTNEALEDYSLRSAAKSFRRWPCWLLANTALGGITFLALEAIGALLILDYGFTNSTLAICCVSLIIIVTGLPISYYASRYNVDVDLLTRGAGFGYFGSTVTSLIYASYTIIFFAIEAAIMAKALQVALGIPLSVGYLVSSLVIIPLVFYGITLINKLQLYTQPFWIILSVSLFAYILRTDPGALDSWTAYAGLGGRGGSFDPLLFGGALSVAFSLVPQIGEQVDYLRFLPDKTRENRISWWCSMAAAGPGWILLGAVKLLCGSFLAVLFMRKAGVTMSDALEPFNLYLNGFEAMFGSGAPALIVSTLFVVICQVKINVTNAYAGSLAWSNFFSRLSHSHPGRVVWLVFNVTISMLLMQFGVFYILHSVLMVYAIFAVAWVGAIFTDLAILKPLGISPPHIEYKRANLYNVNPVGFGAMLIAAGAAVLCHMGLFGTYPKAFAPLIGLGVSIPATLFLALLTGGKYYLARKVPLDQGEELRICTICNKPYEAQDTVCCPAYDEPVCSLCCSLDSICKGFCKASANGKSWRSRIFNFAISSTLSSRFSRRARIFCIHFFNIICALALIFALCYAYFATSTDCDQKLLANILVTLFLFSMLITGIWIWWFSLIQETSLLAEDELDHHVHELEVEVRRREAVSAALEETGSQQRLILENASIGIAYAKEDQLVWSNNRFMWLCGVGKRSPGGSIPLDAFLSRAGIRPGIMDEVQEALAAGGRFSVELPITVSPARRHWCVLSISAVNPVCVRQGSIWLLDDISERKLAEERLLSSEERLKELNESLEAQVRARTEELKRSFESVRQADKMASLGILVSGVAHEINNPASFIRLNIGMLEEVWNGLLPMLEQKNAEGDLWIAGMPFDYARSSIPKLLRGIHQGAERVSTIIRNLKDYARQSPLDMGGTVDINQALTSSLELLSNPLRKATNRLEVETSPGLPCFRGDLRRVEQVLVNLIQNAYQALTRRSQAIRIRTLQNDGHVCFEIEDEGQGIQAEHLKNVCDPFFTTKRDQGGTGLGLSVSAGIVEEHGGIMEIASVPGKGTRVKLLFRVTDA
ncbi:ATP-binding protein [Desulfovibrio aminophilus]|nr:ATP-binding protein [Desulfovibrio aminophilus]MCM0756920.1 ATP-binding protein [Desulfovibrio aminophilus]